MQRPRPPPRRHLLAPTLLTDRSCWKLIPRAPFECLGMYRHGLNTKKAVKSADLKGTLIFNQIKSKRYKIKWRAMHDDHYVYAITL